MRPAIDPEPADRVRVLDAEAGPPLGIVEGAGEAFAFVWPGVGANLRSMHRISLEPGSGTVPLEHPGEAVYYVISGGGGVAGAEGSPREPIEEGSMVHIGPGTRYAFHAAKGGLELVGGPSPVDPALYERVSG